MEVLYKSTRGDGSCVTASQAILQGLSKDGGLFVPTSIPALDLDLEQAAEMEYKDLAFHVMSRFFSDFTDEELKNCIDNAYDSKFDTEEIAPVVKKNGTYYIELFHGATIAFKDMALSILPHLLTTAARKNNITNDIVILPLHPEIPARPLLRDSQMFPGQRSSYFILMAVLAISKGSRW